VNVRKASCSCDAAHLKDRSLPIHYSAMELSFLPLQPFFRKLRALCVVLTLQGGGLKVWVWNTTDANTTVRVTTIYGVVPCKCLRLTLLFWRWREWHHVIIIIIIITYLLTDYLRTYYLLNYLLITSYLLIT